MTDKFNRLCAEAEGLEIHGSVNGKLYVVDRRPDAENNCPFECPDYSTNLAAMLRVCKKLEWEVDMRLRREWDYDTNKRSWFFVVWIDPKPFSQAMTSIGSKRAKDPTQALMKAMMEAFDENP